MTSEDSPNGPLLRHWREPYLLLLEASWPQFLLLVTAAYVLIHLLFALLYLLDPGGIGGVTGEMALPLQAFFFSVETMATIGYGVVYPLSHWVHVVMTLEALAGLILVALITGLAFARFSRMPHCIRFEQTVRVQQLEGEPALLIGLENQRRNTIFDVRVQAVWCHGKDDDLPSYEPLPLQVPSGLPLQGKLTLIHRLDPARPLRGRPGTLVVSFSGVDATLERPIHAAQHYTPEQIAWS